MKKEIFCYTATKLLPYIDWSYFFHAWGITGADNTKSEQAQEAKLDAIAMLRNAGETPVAKAIFARCKAVGRGDDIIIEDNTTLPLLRQQHARSGEPNLCLSDFISPHEDKIGLFAGSSSSAAIYDGNDTYKSLLAQMVASRLAEAATSLMHQEVRTKSHLWGYAPYENLTPEELNAEKFQGIRPAVGYPSLPDQSIIFIIDKLLHLSEIGITLTSNGGMIPRASVCGIMIAHPAARYFAVGNISEEQLHDYATRRGLPTEKAQKFLHKNTVRW